MSQLAAEDRRNALADSTQQALARAAASHDAIAAQPHHRLDYSASATLPAAERNRVLNEWNATAQKLPQHLCIQQLFEAQVERTPDALALLFQEQQLTYRGLNERANQLAHHLQALGVGPETLVGLHMERSPEMIVGMLGILKAGGAYLPLDPAYPSDRLAFLLADAQIGLLLTQARLAGQLPPFGGQVICLDTEGEALARRPVHNPDAAVAPDNLAYVIYTSGSTGKPKGTEIEHRSLVNYIAAAGEVFGLGPGDRMLQFASVSFDAAAEEIYCPLTRGAALVLRTDAMLDSVSAFLQACRAWQLTVLDLPTAYWHALTLQLAQGDAVFPEQLRLVIIGGERALMEPVQTWRKCAPSHVRLINTYGPTEATIVATLCELGAAAPAAALPVVPIGRPVANVQIYLLDANLEPVAVGAPGEIHIGGAGLARGYRNRPELTAEKFIPNPFRPGSGERLYKTGDLARYLPDGNLDFVGRHDDQVKVRGFRVELGEIEAVLDAHPAVGQGAVVAWDDGAGSKQLAAYVVAAPGQELTVAALREHLAGRLPSYMVPAAFVVLDSFPLTPNGKVDRKALPPPQETREETRAHHVAPRNEVERKIAEIWQTVLGREKVGVTDNLFDLGIHSLLVFQVQYRLERAFGVDLTAAQMFQHPTVEALAAYLQQLRQAADAPAAAAEVLPLKPVARQGPTPLSFSQERLWFLNQMNPGSTAYNILDAVALSGALDVAALGRSFSEIVRRHEALRTRFVVVDGKAEQVVDEHRPLEMPLVDLQHLAPAAAWEEARRLAQEEGRTPFDLACGPLLRTLLIRLAADEHLLVVSCHHIVADGWSIGVIMRELAALYPAFAAGRPSPLPPLPIQYADYAWWQRQWAEAPRMQEELAYWQRKLAGPLPALDLPTDYPRPALASNRGARRDFVWDRELVDALQAFSLQEGATLFMTLLAAFNVLLHRYTRQEDILVGSPVAGRNHPALEGLIGFFINNLVLRTDLSGAPTFRQLLQRVRQETLAAFDNQDVPFHHLVEVLHPERDPSRSPLFQILFSLQNRAADPPALAGVTLKPLEIATDSARFDLTLDLVEHQGGLDVQVEYCTDLFEEATIRRLMGHYATLLRSILANPDGRIGELPLLSGEERRQLLEEWNATAAAYPRDVPVHRLFEAQAAERAEAVAVSFAGERLRYGELNARANQLARHLQEQGVGVGSLVGIYMERCAELVVALLAVHKAGGAYLPLDPAFPGERLAFMVEDSQTRCLIAQAHLTDGLPVPASQAEQTRVVLIDADWPQIAEQADGNLAEAGAYDPERLAYVLYTSGSTGRPKGVQVPQRALVNFLLSMQQTPGLGAEDTLLSVTTLSFDIAGLEIFLPLITGAQVELVSYATAADGAALLAALERSGATVMQATPATWRLLLGAGWPGTPGLKVLCGGEAMPGELANQLLGRCASLWNMYGPTETTIWSTVQQVTAGQGVMPIGRPIANTQVYILDGAGQPTPVGVAGELYIGGEGVALGYLNRPELTAEKFVPDPFAGSGAKMYRTGDLARWRADGNLEFLGRMDFQVKIRGFRIELGEIEALLDEHPAIRQAVVTAREDTPGDRRLVAYLTLAGTTTPTTADLRSYLKEKLPDYMAPAVFVVLDSFPLTPNGKVDRKALPAPQETDAERSSAYAPPRTALELQLAQIWEQVLELRQVGVNDDFFELGGHSLAAARLFGQIETWLGRSLPLATLFQAPTIAKLAAVLQNDQWTPPWSSLVPIQPLGSKPPFFCVHGFGGDVVGYRDLALLLGPDQPFYGFQARGLNDMDVPHTDIAEMAADYITFMRRLQPDGPYYLGGYCYGGVVAYEMARQLVAQGERVNLVAVLEGYAVERSAARRAHWRPRVLASFLRNLPYWLHDNLQPNGPYGHVLPWGKQRRPGQPLPPWQMWRGPEPGAVPANDFAARRMRLELAHDLAMDRYQPGPYPGRVALFRVKAMSLFRAHDPAMGWSRYAQSVDVRMIAGAHYNILEQPYVADLAAQLRQSLEEAQREENEGVRG